MCKKISIIIPVYNAERFLRRCLDSVLNQSYSNWECIIVDDGSKDSSFAICDEYVKTDSRFKVIHKENGGVSEARNIGLSQLSGEWVTFVDSDDELTLDALKYFTEGMERYPKASVLRRWTQNRHSNCNRQRPFGRKMDMYRESCGCFEDIRGDMVLGVYVVNMFS